MLPLILWIVVTSPGWFVWIFLSDARRDSAIAMADRFVGFVRATGEPSSTEITPVPTRPPVDDKPALDPLQQAVAAALRQQLPASGMGAKSGEDPDVEEVHS
ncbi:hypothetical protein [Streptomyces sp. LN325]|uniref:hypothetical protein n=1 Tax=Streptomyces sp. LN325 TaxID=3112976 RepID=UPI00371CE277